MLSSIKTWFSDLIWGPQDTKEPSRFSGYASRNTPQWNGINTRMVQLAHRGAPFPRVKNQYREWLGGSRGDGGFSVSHGVERISRALADGIYEQPGKNPQ